MDGRKEELIARVRDRRERLALTMSSLDDRLAVIGEIKDKAFRVGRITAIVVAVTTLALASALFLRALTPRRGRRRR